MVSANPNLPTICMVCSAARSGSTMLDLLLGGNSKAASLGEFSFLGKALALDQPCTCGETVLRCSAWAEVFSEILRRRNIDLTSSPYALEEWHALASTVVDSRHQTRWFTVRQKLVSAYCDLVYGSQTGARLNHPLPYSLHQRCKNAMFLYETIGDVWGSAFGIDTLIDSSKIVHKAVALKQFAPQKIKVIFLTRDGRGVFHSRLSSGFSHDEALRGWRRYNLRAQKLLPRHFDQTQLLRLKYEDLVEQPEQSTRRVCEFLSIPFEEAMLTLQPQHAHLVNGNDMRLKGEQKISPDTRWRNELEVSDLAWFEKNERGLNAKLGY